MGNTVLIELKNNNALNLLYDLEKMNILKVIKENATKNVNVADRFIGVLTKEQGKDLKKHINKSREEWDITL